jgi:hypothetical protein
MLQSYKEIKFKPQSLRMIDAINDIIDEYSAAGYTLTVRQLYYQLVARAIVENTLRSYKNVASLINDARIAGMIDWDMIEDRTRDFITRSRWSGGRAILDAVAQQFHMDMWANQPRRVFAIVEKEALVGVLQRVCHEYDVPLLAARGYPSASVVREFADSVIEPTINSGQGVLILHLGDHDPSGIDMTRDLEERLRLFSFSSAFEMRRIALTMDQVNEEQPPPNPAKVTDSRFEGYRRLYGDESWELDALNPAYLTELVILHVRDEIEPDRWAAREEEIAHIKTRIREVARSF